MANLNKVMLIAALSAEYETGLSIPDLSDKFDLPRSACRKLLMIPGRTLRQRGSAIRLSAWKIGDALRGTVRQPFTAEHRLRIGASRRGVGKGTSAKKGSYVQITMGPDKHRGEHVVIMEAIIGRRIVRGEVVHHKDENKQNNNPANLQLMSRPAHTRLHRLKKIYGIS